MAVTPEAVLIFLQIRAYLRAPEPHHHDHDDRRFFSRVMKISHQETPPSSSHAA
jgi:hypothetical protein